MNCIYLFVGKVDPLLDLCLQIGQHLVEPSLFVVGDLAVSQDLGDAIGSEFAGGGKEGSVGDGGLDKGTLDNVIGSVHGLQDLVGEQVSGVCHGKSGGSGTGLGLDDLVSSELGAIGNGGELVVVGGISGNLGEEGQDGDSGVSSNHGDIDFRGIASGGSADERVGTAVVFHCMIMANNETKASE